MKQIRDSSATTSSRPRCTYDGSTMRLVLEGGPEKVGLMGFRARAGAGRSLRRLRPRWRRYRTPILPVLTAGIGDPGCGPERDRREQGPRRDEEHQAVAPEHGQDARQDRTEDRRRAAERAVHSRSPPASRPWMPRKRINELAVV